MSRLALGSCACLALLLLAACAHAPPAVPERAQPCALSGDFEMRSAEIEQCIADLTTRITAAKAPSDRAKLLGDRATAYGMRLPDRTGDGEAALADLNEALGLSPNDVSLRDQRATLLIGMKKYEDALRDSEILIRAEPSSIDYASSRAAALTCLKRYDDAIAEYTRAIGLAGTCAEANVLQRQIDDFRHAYDPYPDPGDWKSLTEDEKTKFLEEEQRKIMARLLPDPDPALRRIGFSCAPTSVNDMESWSTQR